MSHSLSDLLLRYAQQFEDQHAPQNMTIALREAARELDRLYAGGCARYQGTTQYCAEAASLAAENERLTAALDGAEAWLDRWAQHVGVCRGGDLCTCGLSFIRLEARAALKEPST
jgi:hypothetical protein